MKRKIILAPYWCGVILLISNVVYLPILTVVSLIAIPVYIASGALRGLQEYLRELSQVMSDRTWCFKGAESLMKDYLRD